MLSKEMSIARDTTTPQFEYHCFGLIRKLCILGQIYMYLVPLYSYRHILVIRTVYLMNSVKVICNFERDLGILEN